MFVSCPGGVGKSHVISLIRNDTVRLLRLHVWEDTVAALLTAPTGGAAFNIEGMTLHSGLVLSISQASLCRQGLAQHFEDEALQLAAVHH